MEATLYYVLYVCLFYILGNEILRLVWVYWFCRPVSILTRIFIVTLNVCRILIILSDYRRFLGNG